MTSFRHLDKNFELQPFNVNQDESGKPETLRSSKSYGSENSSPDRIQQRRESISFQISRH